MSVSTHVSARLSVAFLICAIFPDDFAQAQTASESRAYGESTSLELVQLLGNVGINRPPQPEVSGSAPPAYDVTQNGTPAPVSDPATGEILQTGNITVRAASDVPAGILALAESRVEDVQLSLAELLPLLTIAADEVYSSAEVSGPCNALSAVGQTRIENGTSGGLVGGDPISNEPDPNTVMLDQGGIRVVLNEQILTGNGSESLRLEVNGMRISLDGASLAGIGTLSGEMVIAHSEAQMDVAGCSDLLLDKTDALDPVPLADPVNYTVLVTNQGPDDAQDVVVTDSLPAGATYQSSMASQGPGCQQTGGLVTCPLGQITVSQSATIQVSINAQSPGTILNTASVTATQSDPDTSNNSAFEETLIQAPPEADVFVALSDAPDPVLTGGQLSYSISVTNNGADPASNVILTGTLPTGASFLSASASQGTCSESGGNLNCALGSLADSASASVALEVSAPAQPGTIQFSAQVFADEEDPDMANNSAVEQTQVQAPPQADLSLALSDSPDPVMTGDLLSYSISITNNGPASASNAVLSGILPAGSSMVTSTPSQGSCSEAGGSLSCALGSLAGAASVTVQLVAPSEPGTVQFSAEVSADEQDPDTANNSAVEQTEVVSPPQADLSLALSDSPDPVLTGGQLSYSITLANSGPDAASNVALIGTLPTGSSFLTATPSQGSCSEAGGSLSCALGSLAGAASVSVQLLAPSEPGAAQFSAEVSADEQDPDRANNSAVEQTEVQAPFQADLSLALSDSPDPVLVNGQLTYSISINNAGPDTAENVAMNGSLPAGTSFLAAAPSQGSCSEAGGSLSCALGSLAGAASVSVQLLAPSQPGTVQFSAEVAADEQDPDTNNNSAVELTQVEAPSAADLSLTMSDSPDPVTVGQQLTYSIVVTNNGPDEATDVVLSDNLPLSVALLQVMPSQGSCQLNSSLLTCQLGTIRVGDTVSLHVVVEAAPVEVLTNFAQVAGAASDPRPADNSSLEETDVLIDGPQSDLSITKEVSASLVNPGDELAYTLTVMNFGPADASQVLVRDKLPGGVEFLEATAQQGSCSELQGLVECDIGSLPSGGRTQIEIRIRALTPGILSNLALVTSEQPDPEPCNNGDEAQSEVLEHAVLSARLSDSLLVDADGNGRPSQGDTLRLEATINNSGPTAAEGVAFVLFPDPNASLLNGSVETSSGVVSIGNDSGQRDVRVEAGHLGSGEEVSIQLDLSIQRGEESGTGTLSHQGIVRSDSLPALLTADPQTPALFDPTVTVLTDTPHLQATLAVASDPSGSRLFEATVTNLGHRRADGVVVQDASAQTLLIEGIGARSSVQLQDLLPGQSASLQFLLPVSQAVGPSIQERRTQAVVLSDGQAAQLSSDWASLTPEQAVWTAAADGALLDAEMSAHLFRDGDEDGNPSEGDSILYLVRLRNLGNRAAINLVLAERPDGVSLLEADSARTGLGRIVSGGLEGDRLVEAEIASLAPGEAVTVSYLRTLPVPLSDLQKNLQSRFLVQAENHPPLLSRSEGGAETRLALGNEAQLDWTPQSLLLDDLNADGAASPGERVLIRLRLVNRGTSDARQVSLTLTPGTGLQLAEDSMQVSPLAAVSLPQPGTAQILLDRLASGESITVCIAADVAVSLPPEATFLTTGASLSYGSEGSSASHDEFTIATPLATSTDLVLSQIAMPEDPQAGEELTIFLRLRNQGPATASDVELIEQLAAQFTQASSDSGLCQFTPGQATCQLGELPAGGRVELAMKAVAQQSGRLLSEASAQANQQDYQPGNSQSALEIEVGASELLFPFVLSGLDDFTGCAVSNVSGGEALLDIEARGADGSLLEAGQNPSSEALPASSQVARLARELLSLPQADEASSGWLRIRSDKGPLGSFFQFGDGLQGPLTQLDGSVAQLRSSKVLLFTRVFEGPSGFPEPGKGPLEARTWLSIANPHSDKALLSMRLFGPDGLQIGGEALRELPAGGVLRETVQSLFDLTEGVSGGHVRVDVGGSGAIGFELVELPESILGLNAVAPGLEQRLYSAQLASGPDIFTSLKLVNSSAGRRTVRLLAHVEDGGLLRQPLVIALDPQQSLESSLAELFDLGEAVAVGSLEVEADGPGVVGDVVFGDPGQARFAAALPLQTTTSRRAVFSHVANTASQAVERSKAAFTGFAFYNPGSTLVQIRLSVFEADGTPLGSTAVNLGPRFRLSRLLTELIPESAGLAGGFVLVESDSGLVAQELFGNLDLTFLSAVPPTVLEYDGERAAQCSAFDF